MEKKFLKTIEKYNMINKGDTVILGFSGGCDSLSLFYLLLKYKEYLGITLECVHINHNLCPESLDDVEFCKDICNRNNIKLHLYDFDVKKLAKEVNLCVEEAGRNYRYEIFNNHCIDETYKIAIAHNKNDVAETFLMRLFRGAGVQGLISINPKRQNVIRPIIEIERVELDAYLKAMNQEYCTDPFNLLPVYTRNKIRLDILPKIKETFNPSIVSTIYDTAKILEEEQDFIQKVVIEKFDTMVNINKDSATINLSLLKKEHTYLQKQILFKTLSSFIPNNKDINKKHINNLIAILNSNDGNKTLDLPNNLLASKNYESLNFSFKENKSQTLITPTDLSLDELIYLPTINKYLYATVYDNSKAFYDDFNFKDENFVNLLKNIQKDLKLNIVKHQVFCYDSVYDCLNLKIRSRENGDKIHIKNSGTKKLKDYFIDKKINKDLRDYIPIIAKDTSVLWVLDNFYTANDCYEQYTEQMKILTIFIMEEDNGKRKN